MMSVVIVGAGATRAFAAGGATRVYTPRGYSVTTGRVTGRAP